MPEIRISRIPVLAIVLLQVTETSADWPQWRGPNRDGVVHGVAVPAKWPKTLTEAWKAPVGEGVSSPVAVGGNVYVFTRQKDNEFVVCLDLQSGKEKWRSEPYSAPYEWGAGEGTFSKGPRSTPTVTGGRVYILGVGGILSCLDAKTGGLLWRKDCKPYPHYSGNSPLVEDGLCIVHYGDTVQGKPQGGLTAFDAATGDVKWCFADNSRYQSVSPIVVNLAGERQVVTCTSWDLLGVSLATGKKLWNFKIHSVNGAKIVTPVVYKDLIIFGDAMEPLRAVRLEKGDKGIVAKEVWADKRLPLYMSSPILAGDLLFGMSTRQRGTFFCMDAGSGKILWEDGDQETGHTSIVRAGDVLLFLTDRNRRAARDPLGGRLVVAKASAKAFAPVAEYIVSDTPTWAHPVFLGDRILIRDAATLRLLRIGH